MNKKYCGTGAALLSALFAIAVAGCKDNDVPCNQTSTSHTTPAESTESPSDQSTAPTFNPTVTPPPVTQKVAAYQGYYFNPAPAPVPAPTPIIQQHRHRYLHIETRDGLTYLADNYGDYYDTGRDDNGDLYPVYQDQNTFAVYPLYYDSDRDRYYRCVDDGDSGYYRNYCGDPEDQFYQGDPDQQQECESDDSQPFVINYDVQYSNWRGYDPQYGHYDGDHYSRHDRHFVTVLPLIVAAFILFEPSNGGGDHEHDGGRVVVGNRYYFRQPVTVAGQGNGHGGRYFAVPGPPLGHFHGYDPAHQPQKIAAGRYHAPMRLAGFNAPLPTQSVERDFGSGRLAEADRTKSGHGNGPGGNRETIPHSNSRQVMEVASGARNAMSAQTAVRKQEAQHKGVRVARANTEARVAEQGRSRPNTADQHRQSLVRKQFQTGQQRQQQRPQHQRQQFQAVQQRAQRRPQRQVARQQFQPQQRRQQERQEFRPVEHREQQRQQSQPMQQRRQDQQPRQQEQRQSQPQRQDFQPRPQQQQPQRQNFQPRQQQQPQQQGGGDHGGGDRAGGVGDHGKPN